MMSGVDHKRFRPELRICTGMVLFSEFEEIQSAFILHVSTYNVWPLCGFYVVLWGRSE
jgi:hypothetical protein